jgi:predicted SAM-dependent methyltransferase
MECTFLHVGCGAKTKAHTTPEFSSERWRELRFDIDPAVKPDITGTMTNMSAVGTETVDGLFSSHNVEHLYPHEVPVAFREFTRVLKLDGFAVITCPDLQSIAALVAQNKLLDTAYQSNAGPITPLDMLFGHRASLARGNLFMAHHCGFTRDVLAQSLQQAGFQSVRVLARPDNFDLWAVACRQVVSRDELLRESRRHGLPA